MDKKETSKRVEKIRRAITEHRRKYEMDPEYRKRADAFKAKLSKHYGFGNDEYDCVGSKMEE